MADEQIPGVPSNANEAFFDAMVRHQIGLLRVSGRVRNRILELLDATEADMAETIRRRLQGVSGIERPATLRRLESLVKSIRAMRSEAWVKSAAAWREELLEIAKAEPEFIASALRTVSPVQLDLALPSAQLLTSIVTTRPFEGKVLKDWASNIRRVDLDRIEQQIRIGVTQGETGAAIARRIVGTAQQRGRNGVTQITRRGAEAITRTAVNAITNQAKRETFKANSDIFEEELYVATLDGRTTPICRSLDGKTFPVGEGSIPPLHFNCRSLRVAILDGNVIGQRPARRFTQRQLLDEYARSNDLSRVSSRNNLPRGHKGAFDRFAQQRKRELTGTVDAKVSYGEWLKRQPASFQDDVLGKTKGQLFRKGDLSLDKFVNRQGDELTLQQLATTELDAFRRAGLDPDDFD